LVAAQSIIYLLGRNVEALSIVRKEADIGN